MQKDSIANLLLRLGVAFAFLYAAIDAFVQPSDWLDYLPSFALKIAPALTLLHVFGVIEILLALWLLSGYKIVIPAALAALMLVAIVFFNMPVFQLLFRDLSIAAASLALAVMSYRSTPSGSLPGQR
jgi:uncharacterized membrane protein YphA (DoxX/SURF4 family)